MAQKDLRANIILGGALDNSFGTLGSAISGIGYAIDGISRKLIDFGKESLNVYRSYEDSMLEAEGALATSYGRGTSELKKVMDQLDAAAAQWASSTIFHTDDVADAINKAAHANWDLDKILTGMPAAMRLAQAGGMDLSEGLDYIIKTTNAAGIEFQDLEGWIDSWAFAANSSAADIRTLGEAMTKMGATMRFADSNEELLTMLAVLHDAGTTGSAAGTLLRNSMIRLIAPTKKASDVMGELGVSADDIDEALAEVAGDTAGAVKKLEELGFTPYDKNGNLKGFLEIFTDLNNATKGLSEQERYDIWSAIFPTRTITGAMALMQAAEDNWNGLMDAFKRGDQQGYGQYLSDTMMSGLTGSIEKFKSKVEELERVVGKNLSENVETIAGNLGKFIDVLAKAGQDSNVSNGLGLLETASGWVADIADGISGFDAPMFDALVAGLGTLATLGSGLVTAGTGIGMIAKFIGAKPLAIMLGATAIISLVEAIDAYNESEFEDKFGDLDMDTTELNEYLEKVREPFDKSTESVNAFRSALNETVENYKTVSGEFSNTMLSDMLTQKELTPKDFEAYVQYGENMVGYVKQGITQGGDLSAEFWAGLFTPAGGENPDTTNPAYQAIIGKLNDEKGELLLRAEGIGSELRKAITDAFADNKLDQEEIDRIKGYYKQLNEIMAQAQREAQNEQDYINQQRLLYKSQSVSLDSMEAWINENVIPQRDEQLQWWEENYNTNRWLMEFRKNREIEEAKKTATEKWAAGEEYDLDGELAEIEAEYGAIFAETEKQYKAKVDEINALYGQMIQDLWFNAIKDSDLGYLFNGMYEMALGGSDWNEIYKWALGSDKSDTGLFSIFKTSDTTKVADAIGKMISEMGGIDKVMGIISQYKKNGQSQKAGVLQAMIDTYYSTGGISFVEGLSKGSEESAKWLWDVSRDSQGRIRYGMGDWLGYLFANLQASDYMSPLSHFTLQELIDQGIAIPGEGNRFGIDFDKYFALMKRLEAERAGATITETSTPLTGVEEAPEASGGKSWSEWATENNVTITTNAKEAAEAANKTIDETLTDHTVYIKIERMNPDGTISEVLVPEDYDFWSTDGMADGGRADRPVLFGEAGPEWFIPERHDRNTAGLLLSAMSASGFDLGELVQLAGGRLFADGGSLNSSASLDWGSLDGGSASGSMESGAITVQYSPVIHADNAQGVRQQLIEDKKRLEKWINEWWEKRKLYQTIASYT